MVARLLRTVSALVAVLAFTCAVAQAASRCPAIEVEQLRALAPQDGTMVRLVFFSTWCSACAEHLHTVEGMATWVVGAFDTLERIAQALEHKRLDVPCFMATDALLEALAIRRVPSEWRLSHARGLEPYVRP